MLVGLQVAWPVHGDLEGLTEERKREGVGAAHHEADKPIWRMVRTHVTIVKVKRRLSWGIRIPVSTLYRGQYTD